MNQLNIESVNRKAPYPVVQIEGLPHLYYFHTDYGVDYEISIRANKKQAVRNRLFVRWFNMYELRHQYVIRTAQGMMDGQMNFMAIIVRKDNPKLKTAIEEFEETVRFLFE